MNYLNARSAHLRQGKIRSMFDKAAQYDKVWNLGIGEPDFITPAAICQRAKQALDEGYTHYTPNAGLPALRKAVTSMEKLAPLAYDPLSEVIVTIGGMGALALCLQVVLDPGDEVLIQDPQWLNYLSQVTWAGGVPVQVPTRGEDGFVLDAEVVRRYITPKTKAIVLNSPNNPTGCVLKEAELANLAKLAVEFDLLVLSDEVYDTLQYSADKATTIARQPGMRDRTIVINSFSKAFAMTGWRVGFAAGPAPIIGKMTVLQENFNSCAPAVSQVAALYALDHFELTEEMLREYAARRTLIVEELNKIGGIRCAEPEGAFYVFPDISAFGLSSEAFCTRLLEQQQVVCVPGSAFGACGDGYLRISYASSQETLRQAAQRIGAFVASL